MTYRYHGNYCGPGWSDGQYQDSVVGTAPPIDEFDETCRVHDAAYATALNAHDRTTADDIFIRSNLGQDLSRTVAAVAVATNRVPRWFDPLGNSRYTTHYPEPHDIISLTQNQTIMPNKKTHLRGTQPKVPKLKTNGQTTYAPVARSKTVKIGQPVTTMKGGNTVVSHREYVTLVGSSTTEEILGYEVNPGLAGSFNWLSTIARGYEKYRFRKLIYTYISASSTSERGRVALSFQYDPSAPIPEVRTDFFNVTPNVEEAPWEDIALQVRCPATWLYTRKAGSTGTLNTYDVGKLLIMAALNANNTTALGEVFVEYEVELAKPQYVSALAGRIESLDPAPAGLWATNIELSHGAEVFGYVNDNTLIMKSGCSLLCSLTLFGTGLSIIPPAITQSAGSLATLFTVAAYPNATGTVYSYVFELQKMQIGDTIAFNSSGSTTITSNVMRYAEYSSFQ